MQVFMLTMILTLSFYIRPHVVDLLFIVNCTHQKIKALFCCIDVDCYEKFYKKNVSCFFFLFSLKKEKYTLNSIVLQNLL